MSRYLQQTILLCCLELTDVLGVTALLIALPTLQRDLGASAGLTAFAASAYALVYGSVLPAAGRGSDVFGHRRFVLLGTVLLVAGSLIGALAPAMWMVVASRAIQGLGAAVAMPGAMTLVIRAARSADERQRGLALWTATGAVGGVSGFAFGGIVTDHVGWRWTFAIIAIVGVVLLSVLRAVIPADTVSAAREAMPDGPSIVALPLALGLILAGVSNLSASLWSIAALAIGAALMIWLIRRQRGSAKPLVPPTILRDGIFRLGLYATAILTWTTGSAATLVSFWMQREHGMTSSAAGIRLLAFSVGVIGGSSAGAWLMRRISARHSSAAGFVFIALAFMLIGVGCGIGSPLLATVGLGLSGLGLGCTSVATNEFALADSPDESRGAASGLLSAAAPIGTAFGIAVILQIAHLGSPTVGNSRGVLVGLAANLVPLTWISIRLLRSHRA